MPSYLFLVVVPVVNVLLTYHQNPTESMIEADRVAPKGLSRDKRTRVPGFRDEFHWADVLVVFGSTWLEIKGELHMGESKRCVMFSGMTPPKKIIHWLLNDLYTYNRSSFLSYSRKSFELQLAMPIDLNLRFGSKGCLA